MIRLTVSWWQGVYTGTAGDGRPEWPPAPYRLYAALVSGAHRGTAAQTTRERSALRKLSRHQIAAVWVPEHRSVTLPIRFVPSTSLPAWGATKEPNLEGLLDQSLVLANVDRRSKAEWAEARTVLAVPDVHIDVDDTADPLSDDDLAALRDAARRVPYVGRASHAAEMTLAPTAGGAPSGDHHRWHEGPGGTLRGWDEHTLDLLDREHAAVFVHKVPPSTPASRARQVPLPRPAAERRLRMQATVRFARAVNIPEVTRLVADAHRLVASHTWANMAPPRVVALPDIGHGRASGRVLGIGIVSDDHDDAHRLWGLLTEPFDTVAPQRVKALFPRRWDDPATSWYSATPFVGHPDERVARLQAERDLAAWTGGDIDAEVTFSRRPHRPGQVPWPAPPGGAQQWWVALTTPALVPGPLVLGACREAGYGLFARGER